jgi:hypothetical protein
LYRLDGNSTIEVKVLKGASAVVDVHLSAEQRRALALLDRAERGLTEATLLRAHGFTFELLNGLVHDGLAELATGTVMRGSRTIEVTRMRITNAGRQAIGGAEGDWE